MSIEELRQLPPELIDAEDLEGLEAFAAENADAIAGDFALAWNEFALALARATVEGCAARPVRPILTQPTAMRLLPTLALSPLSAKGNIAFGPYRTRNGADWSRNYRGPGPITGFALAPARATVEDFAPCLLGHGARVESHRATPVWLNAARGTLLRGCHPVVPQLPGAGADNGFRSRACESDGCLAVTHDLCARE